MRIKGFSNQETDAIIVMDVLFARDSDTPTQVKWTGSYDNGDFGRSHGYGEYKADADVNGIRFLPSTGTVTGRYRIWGLKDSSESSSGTGTGVSSFDIDLPAGFTTYRIEYTISNISGNSQIEYTVTDDGFSTVETGASDYEWVLFRYAGSFGGARDGADNSIVTVGASVDYEGIHKLEVINSQDSSLETGILFETAYDNGSPSLSNGRGRYLTASLINGIRIGAQSGTFDVSWKLHAT